MMVETMLESSQDFGMPNGALPQWKREVLQRRAARSRTAAPATPPPAAPAPPEDEELRYGPGIVKRLQSRYLSLALRDAPRRRPSVLRRAASLEQLDERPPPAPRTAPRPPRPASLAAPPAAPAAPRAHSVKRARSVDALSRLARDEPAAPPPPPPPPPLPKLTRTPRRPAPLLREAERPPPDVVRSALRKFESAPLRRAAPSARVSAVLRNLEGPRTSTPEPREFADGPPLSPCLSSPLPSPAPPSEVAIGSSLDSASASNSGDEPPPPTAAPSDVRDEPTPTGVPDDPRPPPCEPRPVSRAALDGIARAGSTVRYAFEAPRAASHLPPLAATNPVLLGRARRVGVIRPMPARTAEVAAEPAATDDSADKSRAGPAAPLPPADGRAERREPPPAALVEPTPRAPPAAERAPSPKLKPIANGAPSPLPNGHCLSRIGAAGIERAWSGSAAPWAESARRARGPAAPSCTSVVFNFSNRKEVPDYIENDGIVLRGSRRNRIKAGEPGVVVLRPEALARADSDSESESEADGAAGPPSPCAVRFVNDNVLINGKSSMPAKPNRDRIAKLKLQFDDSLTRTFEYPAETALCEHEPAPLAANTHITMAALSRYTPSKTRPDEFQLGVARRQPAAARRAAEVEAEAEAEAAAEAVAVAELEAACGAEAARAWSDARSPAGATDLLF